MELLNVCLLTTVCVITRPIFTCIYVLKLVLSVSGLMALLVLWIFH